MEKDVIKLSVRNLVEFVMRAGDIDASYKSMKRALEGTMAHQRVQRSKGIEYTPEVFFKKNFLYKDFHFHIEGRADGVIEIEDRVIVDEIKSTRLDLDDIDENYNMLHWAQAKCYAFMIAEEEDLDVIGVQLSYYNLDTEELKIIEKEYTKDFLSVFFYNLIDMYMVWAQFMERWVSVRDNTIEELDFPFDSYRKGQRRLAVSVYKTLDDHMKLFAQAPTGIGKTISTMFPAVKGLKFSNSKKIFYLTAKTITRQVANEAVSLMVDKGLKIKSLTITAKEKICPLEETICNPEHCKYAKGHFDRVNDALIDIIHEEDCFDRNTIERYSEIHRVCPFEFSLDLILWADIIICDYNYVFDPRVYIKRVFDSVYDNKYTFLIDEAHNLVDRGREMYSAHILKSSVMELRRGMKDKHPKLFNALSGINRSILKIKKCCDDDGYYVSKEMSEDLVYKITKLIDISDEYLATNEKTELYKDFLTFFFECLAYLGIAELFDDNYVEYVVSSGKEVMIKLFCLDPSSQLSKGVLKGNGAVFFSATLSPIDYYKDLLSNKKGDDSLELSSPFDRRNLGLYVSTNISTRYKDRGNSIPRIVEYINTTVNSKIGNYMVFFPSYKFMRDTRDAFIDKYPEINIIYQETGMKEEARVEFLDSFKENPDETMVAFAVMGGLFSEGVDLKGSRLIGSIIVGVGLPQICLERDIIKDHFSGKSRSGFDYSYTYPGMNKVLQSAGRVIRTEEDKGVVVLIDDRFTYSKYQGIFPVEWKQHYRIENNDQLKRGLEYFLNK